MPTRTLLFLLLASLLAPPAPAQQNVALCPDKPRLVLILLIDNVNNQQLEIVRNSCPSKGWNRVMGQGTMLTDAYYDAGGDFAGKNLATLFTGAPAATHGIVSRQWVDRFSGKKVDATYGTLTGTAGDTLAKPTNGALLCSTIAAEIRKIYNREAKILSLGFDPELLIWLGATKAGEPVIWFDPKTGDFVGSNISSDTTRAWLRDFNGKRIADRSLDKVWAPRKDIGDYHQTRFFPESKTRPFYHALAGGQARGRAAGKWGGIPGTPYGNDLLRDAAANAIVFEHMGEDDVPDILTVQFSATPAQVRKQQPLDPESEDLLLGLDANIESLLRLIDGTVGMDNTLVLLTAAQGACDVSETSAAEWSERGSVSLKRATALLNLYLMALHGQGRWVKDYAPSAIYLDQDLCKQKRVPYDTLAAESAEFMMQVKGVGGAYDARRLEWMSSETGVVQQLRRNYHPRRSGDILLRLEPGWSEELDDGSKQTQLWAGEFVPLAFYGWRIPRGVIYERHNMADVAPTICSFLHVAPPDGCQGRPIPIAEKERNVGND